MPCTWTSQCLEILAVKGVGERELTNKLLDSARSSTASHLAATKAQPDPVAIR